MLGLTWKDVKNYTNAASCFRAVLSLESDTETARDAAEQLALVQELLKRTGNPSLKEYTLRPRGVSLRYPDDWLVMTPDDVLKRARGNILVTPECVLVIANPDNWGQNLTIQIHEVPGQGPVSRQELETLVPGVRDEMARRLEEFKEVSHRIIDVAGVPALEFDCTSSAWGKRQRQRSVAFVKSQRLFTITCTAIEGEFADAEAKAFQPVINMLEIDGVSSSRQSTPGSYNEFHMDMHGSIKIFFAVIALALAIILLAFLRDISRKT